MVINKTDLIDFSLTDGPQSIATSAITGAGIERLLRLLASRLVPQLLPPGAPVPFTSDQVSSLQAALAACQQDGVASALAGLLSSASFGSLCMQR